MNNSEIEIIVKKLEKYFIGYKANGNTLKSEAGFEFRFHSSWNNKTTVSGIGGTRYPVNPLNLNNFFYFSH